MLTPRTVVCTFPKLGQAKLQLGFPSVSLNSPDLYALDLLADRPGRRREVADGRRDPRRQATGQRHFGVSDDTPELRRRHVRVDMELAPEKIAEATDAVLKLIEEVKDKPIDEDRMRRAKTQMKADRVKKLQTTEDIADSLAQDYMGTGDPHFPTSTSSGSRR